MRRDKALVVKVVGPETVADDGDARPSLPVPLPGRWRGRETTVVMGTG